MRRTKEDALETREKLLDAAEWVFFERGVSNTTLEQIACAANVTRGAIYWHFCNKIDLLNEVVERVRMPLENTLFEIVNTEKELADLEKLCVDTFVAMSQREQLKRVYTILLLKCEFSEEMTALAEREDQVRSEVTSALTRFFARLQEAGEVTSAEPPHLLSFALHGYLTGLFTDYLRSPERYDMPGDAIRLVGHFFATLRPR